MCALQGKQHTFTKLLFPLWLCWIYVKPRSLVLSTFIIILVKCSVLTLIWWEIAIEIHFALYLLFKCNLINAYRHSHKNPSPTWQQAPHSHPTHEHPTGRSAPLTQTAGRPAGSPFLPGHPAPSQRPRDVGSASQPGPLCRQSHCCWGRPVNMTHTVHIPVNIMHTVHTASQHDNTVHTACQHTVHTACQHYTHFTQPVNMTHTSHNLSTWHTQFTQPLNMTTQFTQPVNTTHTVHTACQHYTYSSHNLSTQHTLHTTCQHDTHSSHKGHLHLWKFPCWAQDGWRIPCLHSVIPEWMQVTLSSAPNDSWAWLAFHSASADIILDVQKIWECEIDKNPGRHMMCWQQWGCQAPVSGQVKITDVNEAVKLLIQFWSRSQMSMSC